MGILIPLLMMLICCLLIWRACDGFELASEYLGRNMSEGVRGGTINAISSSIPELLTTLIALFVLHDKEGFAVGLGTSAGSALFNGMIIPAFCILTVVGAVVLGVRVTSVHVSRKVILRDGLSLIFVDFLLILIIHGNLVSPDSSGEVNLYWWQGAVLMGLYGAYLYYMVTSMKASTNNGATEEDEEEPEEDEPRGLIGNLFYWCSGGSLLDLEKWLVRDHHHQQMKDEKWNAWPLLALSTVVIGASCFLLVKACEWLGSGPEDPYVLFGHELSGLAMPTLFIAVIFASMATSVPDTVISIRDARDGDYDDAVANALGSNVFDVCFALGFPLFLFTLFNGPITLSQETAQASSELLLLLLLLTVCGFFVYYFGKKGIDENGTTYVEMKKGKAIILLGIYVAFAGYIVACSQEMVWAAKVTEMLGTILEWLPRL